MSTVFFLKNKDNKNRVESFNWDKNFKEYKSDDLRLTEAVLKDMAKRSPPGYFYVVKLDRVDANFMFDFSFKPVFADKEYVHVWNKDHLTIRLFNRDLVLENTYNYTDDALEAGLIKLKVMNEKIYNEPIYDIVFLSYDESYADENYTKLKNRFPRAKRIHNIKGIYQAHKLAAEWAAGNNSEMFYVVDADAVITDEFDFSYYASPYDKDSIHVWHSQNPINGLEYGYGGVKLFPTKTLLRVNKWNIDFTTTVSEKLKMMPSVSNITAFNSDPYSTWRSAFRECVKLSSRIIPNQENEETLHRLNVWRTVGKDQPYGEFSLIGANEGKEFGELYNNNADMLNQINDFDWLEKRFSS